MKVLSRDDIEDLNLDARAATLWAKVAAKGAPASGKFSLTVVYKNINRIEYVIKYILARN